MADKALRHAYLIIAHGNFPILERQIRFLDSENADIFVHIDAKVKGFDFDYFRAIPRRSRLIFTDRLRIYWGHHSQILCELLMLRAAVPGGYDYYHLLSGVDVPLKTRAYIESYFAARAGTNFLHIQHPLIEREHTDRVRYYYPLQRFLLQSRILRLALRRLTVLVQRPFVDRTRSLGSDAVLQKGANWFSITHALAEYVLSREDWVRDHFLHTFCADEVFLHTLVMNSPFRDTLPSDYCGEDHKNCLRYVDWVRGKPYTFTDEDLEELLTAGAPYLFARKFDYARWPGVVNALFDRMEPKEKEDAAP